MKFVNNFKPNFMASGSNFWKNGNCVYHSDLHVKSSMGDGYFLRVRDRSGYEPGLPGSRNAEVTATSGSRSSSAVTARDGRVNMNVEPGLSALIDPIIFYLLDSATSDDFDP